MSDLKHWLERVDGKFMGTPYDIPPHDAILWALRTTAGEVIYCDEQIRRLSEEELFERPVKETQSTTEDGNEIFTEVTEPEIISRWVQLRDTALDRVAKYSKMALDVGIEERQIALAENQAHQLVSVITHVLTDLGHDLTDLHTREIVRTRLLEASKPIEGTATDITGES